MYDVNRKVFEYQLKTVWLSLMRISLFVRFYLKAKTRFDVHSSFLHQLLIVIQDTEKEYYAFHNLEEERQRLLSAQEEVSVNKWGAGSTITHGNSAHISQIARRGISCPAKCRLLFQLALHFRPANILELGTCLGISSGYMASASKKCFVTTIEGNPDLVRIAKDVHFRLGLCNINCIQGLFTEQLDILASSVCPWDMVYLDGHHDEEATLALFDQIVACSHNDTIVVLDDIYWSAGMARAWQKITHHPQTTLCLDVFHVGIVFFNKALSKEYYPIIPYRMKPWRIGLFS